MTNIAKIFTVAVTLVVGTGAISGIALASVDHTFLSRPPGKSEAIPSVTWSGERYPWPPIGSAIGPTSQASPFRHLEWGAVSLPPIGSAIKAMGSSRPTRLGA